MPNSKFPRSSIVVLGPNTVEALLPSTLLSQAESLLDAHRIPDAASLADQQRKKIEAKLEVDEDEVRSRITHKGLCIYAGQRRTNCDMYIKD